MNDSKTDIIWHSTSMEAMIQIVKKGTILLSSAAYLNDTHEIS